MGYVEEQLLPGEQVKYRTHLHKLIYVIPGLFAALMTAGAVWAFSSGVTWAGLVAIAVGFIPLLVTHIKYTSSEFAVTDKRVIIKTGWIKRRTLETMLAKVEGIGVDQGFLARILGFGTITVTGTGGTKEPFPNIASPLEFRRQVQGQVSAADHSRGVPAVHERILARARVWQTLRSGGRAVGHCLTDYLPQPGSLPLASEQPSTPFAIAAANSIGRLKS